LTQLLQYMTEQEIPEVARIKEFIPTIEKRVKIGFWGKRINLHDYLGKGALTLLQTKKNSWGTKYYGELNAFGDEHGRGIKINEYGDITIGYFESSW
jgi:hypothetical protein